MDTIKTKFGKLFRAARDTKRLSRAALGMRLGISPKTIQSWENGRTWIEKLSLIPAIESELDVSISEIIRRATDRGRSAVAESPAAYAGGCHLDVYAPKVAARVSEKRLQK